MNKAELRKKALALRGAIPSSSHKERSLLICEAIKSYGPFKKAKHILFYYPFGSEVNLLPLMEEFLASKEKTLYLPCIEKEDFLAKPLGKLTFLKKGKYGIPEPAHAEGDYDCLIDLVMVPGLASTPDGSRLGMGKGYYDRYLKKMNSAHTLGIAFTEQVISSIPKEAHDLPVDKVMTDAGLI